MALDPALAAFIRALARECARRDMTGRTAAPPALPPPASHPPAR